MLLSMELELQSPTDFLMAPKNWLLLLHILSLSEWNYAQIEKESLSLSHLRNQEVPSIRLWQEVSSCYQPQTTFGYPWPKERHSISGCRLTSAMGCSTFHLPAYDPLSRQKHMPMLMVPCTYLYPSYDPLSWQKHMPMLMVPCTYLYPSNQIYTRLISHKTTSVVNISYIEVLPIV